MRERGERGGEGRRGEERRAEERSGSGGSEEGGTYSNGVSYRCPLPAPKHKIQETRDRGAPRMAVNGGGTHECHTRKRVHEQRI